MRMWDLIVTLLFASAVLSVDPFIIDKSVVTSLSHTFSPLSDSSEQSCAICWNSLDRPFQAFQCTHKEFHASCISTYREEATVQSFRCPMCRAKPLSLDVQRDAIYLTRSATRRAIKALRQEEFKSFFDEIQGFILTDEKKVKFVSTVLRNVADHRGIFDELIFLLTSNDYHEPIEDWSQISRLFTLYVNATTDISIVESLIKLSFPSAAHIVSHEECVARKDWRCASAFVRHYFDGEEAESLGSMLGPVFMHSTLKDASASYLAELLSNSFNNMPSVHIKKASKYLVRNRKWKHLLVVINYLVSHPSGIEKYEAVFEFFRKNTHRLTVNVVNAFHGMLDAIEANE